VAVTAIDLGRARLGLGTAQIASDRGGPLWMGPQDRDVAVATVRAAIDAGVGFIDTAPFYGWGLAERIVADAVAGLAVRPPILTKCGTVREPSGGFREDTSPRAVRADVEASLKRLGLDRVDTLFIHDIDRWTHGDAQPDRFRQAMTGAYRALRRLRDEGVVSAIGVGVNEWEVCQQAAEAGDFDGFLLAGRYTLLEQEALRSFLPLCERRGLFVVIGGPFNSGILATGAVADARYNYQPAPPEILARVVRIEAVCRRHEVPLAAAALQFPLAHPAVQSVIPGARSADEVRQNLALLRVPIPRGLWKDLSAAGLLHPDAPMPS
jgi:D-threo-aldose 1-dehydrogenase